MPRLLSRPTGEMHWLSFISRLSCVWTWLQFQLAPGDHWFQMPSFNRSRDLSSGETQRSLVHGRAAACLLGSSLPYSPMASFRGILGEFSSSNPAPALCLALCLQSAVDHGGTLSEDPVGPRASVLLLCVQHLVRCTPSRRRPCVPRPYHSSVRHPRCPGAISALM